MSKRNQNPRAQSAKDPRQYDLIELIEGGLLSNEQRETLRGLLSTPAVTRNWRGQTIIPPGSMLDQMVNLFARTTDFPLEIPAFLTLNSIAAHLLDRNIRVRVAGRQMQADLWTTLLAPSGSGKTLTLSIIESIMPLKLFPESTSSARFIQELSLNNRSAWFQDEWAQVIRRIENQSYAEEMREYLLKIFDNKPISRRLAKDTIVITDPALVIVGINVPETFISSVSAESMLDGFMQRFQFVIGDPDPERTPDMFPIYRVGEEDNLVAIRATWASLSALELHPEYVVGNHAEAAYTSSFRKLFAANREMPASFFRRVMWRAFKYALVYHFLLGKRGVEIDAEDVGWALRVSEIHLIDARRILNSYNLNELETLICKSERLQARLGRRPTKRELISGVRGIKSGNLAVFILDVMKPVEKAKSAQPEAANENVLDPGLNSSRDCGELKENPEQGRAVA